MTSSSSLWSQRRHRKSDHSFTHDKDIAFDRHFTQNRDKIRVFENNLKSNKENIASRRAEYRVFWASNKRKLKYTFNEAHESMKTIVKNMLIVIIMTERDECHSWYDHNRSITSALILRIWKEVVEKLDSKSEMWSRNVKIEFTIEKTRLMIIILHLYEAIIINEQIKYMKSWVSFELTWWRSFALWFDSVSFEMTSREIMFSRRCCLMITFAAWTSRRWVSSTWRELVLISI